MIISKKERDLIMAKTKSEDYVGAKYLVMYGDLTPEMLARFKLEELEKAFDYVSPKIKQDWDIQVEPKYWDKFTRDKTQKENQKHAQQIKFNLAKYNTKSQKINFLLNLNEFKNTSLDMTLQLKSSTKKIQIPKFN